MPRIVLMILTKCQRFCCDDETMMMKFG